MTKPKGIKVNAVIQYVLIYVLLCFQGSMGFRTYNDIFVLGTIIIGVLFFITKSKKIPAHYVLFLCTLLSGLFFERFITNDGVYLSSIVSILSRFIIVMVAYYYNESRFVDRLVKAIVCFATISIVGYAITLINANILTMLLSSSTEIVETYWNNYTTIFYGKFLFVYRSGLMKNIGIYHEPGLYQIVLNVGLYCLLLKEDLVFCSERTRLKYIIILTATVLTCMSTTGYIGMAALFLIYFLFVKSKTTKKMKWIIIISIIVLMTYNSMAGDESFLYRAIFSKLFDTSGNFDLSVSTGQSRVISMFADLEVFKQNPFGIGYLDYNDTWKGFLSDQTISDVSSCVGITKILATLGIGITALIIGYYIYLSSKNQSLVEKIAFWIMVLNTSLAQPQIWFPVIIVLLLINNRRILRRRELYDQKSNMFVQCSI